MGVAPPLLCPFFGAEGGGRILIKDETAGETRPSALGSGAYTAYIGT